MVPTYHRLQDSPRLNQDITMVIRLSDQLRKGLDRDTDTSVDITKDYSQGTKLPFMKIVTPFKNPVDQAGTCQPGKVYDADINIEVVGQI
jgi:hypothetical protein